MSIQNLYPAIAPSLSLDFANVKALDPRVTFARASSGKFYNGVTVAKAEENLLIRSQELNTSPWAAVRGAVTANDTTAPDGTSTAEKFTEDTTASDTHVVQNAFGSPLVATYAISVFAKYDDCQWITVGISAGVNAWAAAKFDIQNGVLGSTSQSGGGYSATSSSITSVGGGWYRCVLIAANGAASSSGFNIFTATDGTTFTAGKGGGESFTGTSRSVYLWGAQLEQRSSVTAYTATTTQPITNYIPVLLTASDNVARFDHNPTTGESLGLLIEEQRTNLLQRSEEFDNAYWTKTNSSITANTIVAPDGTLTGDKLIADTSNGQHQVIRGAAGLSGVHSFSVYAKAGEYSFLSFGQGNPGVRTYFDLTNGTVVGASVGSGLSSATITPVGNGWYRCAGVISSIGANANFVIGVSNSTSSETFTGNGYDGIFIWGAQLESGAFSTSYIKTVAATATRAADAASMTGTNFSSWYRADEGTLYAESSTFGDLNAGNNYSTCKIDDTTNNNQISLFRGGAVSMRNRFWVATNNSDQALFVSAESFSANRFDKQAGAYKVNDFAFSANAESVLTDTSGTVPVVSQMRIGNYNSSFFLNGTIKKIAFYPSRLQNSQLQALTQ